MLGTPSLAYLLLAARQPVLFATWSLPAQSHYNTVLIFFLLVEETRYYNFTKQINYNSQGLCLSKISSDREFTNGATASSIHAPPSVHYPVLVLLRQFRLAQIQSSHTLPIQVHRNYGYTGSRRQM